jgi:AraC family transcriptional regulator of adaptative response / DNA-3-methyladenine glycosylase II
MCYSAYAARDARFDGVFFIGVTSTGIYCRPVCTARTPKATNCRFFPSAAAAECASFRPCMRCRPELAPGRAPIDGAQRVAGRLVARMTDGAFHDGAGVEDVAREFHMSSRQLRRIVHSELGASPVDLMLTRRLLLAKQLLTETPLPIAQVAYSSGFASLRRFNDAFLKRYHMPPTRLRAAMRAGSAGCGREADGAFTLRLAYRPPFDWAGMLAFLSARAMQGVECIGLETYSRTVRIGANVGWVNVRNAPEIRCVVADISLSLAPGLATLLQDLRNLFDLAARPDVIADHLARDPEIARDVAAHPGLRLPGAFDAFELAVRAILGQQVSIKAATTLAGRFATTFGDPIRTPNARLTRLSPTAARVAAASIADIAALGILPARARAIAALATEMAAGNIRLHSGADVDDTMRCLRALPGIGPWTAHYIAMRALRWPDAFPAHDLVLQKRLRVDSATKAEVLSQKWRPWRSYATLHLWARSSAAP